MGFYLTTYIYKHYVLGIVVDRMEAIYDGLSNPNAYYEAYNGLMSLL